MPTSPVILTSRSFSRRTFVTLLAALLVVGTLGTTFAKRSAPAAVEPVTIGNVKYSAPSEAMGYVIATDVATGKELWRERIYVVALVPGLEEDVQHVFISALKEEKGLLLITNEKGARFSLDPKTRKVVELEK